MCYYILSERTFYFAKVLIGLQNYEKYLLNSIKNRFIKEKIKKNQYFFVFLIV